MAFEAAHTLRDGAGFRVSLLDFGDADPALHRQGWRRTAGQLLVIGRHPVMLGGIDCDAHVSDGFRNSPGEVFGNRARGPLAFGYRGDDDPWAKGQVATGKNVGP